MSPHRQSIAYAVLFGSSFASVELIAAMLAAPYSVYQIVWMRYGVHLVIMLCVLGWRELTLPFATPRMPRQIYRSLLMLAMPACWGWAAAHGADRMALAAGLAATPLFVALLAGLRGGRLDAKTGLGAVLSAGGAVALAIHHVGYRAADVAPLAAGLCLALYVVETRRLRQEPLRVNLFHTAFWVFLFLTPVQPSVWTPPPAHDWPLIAAIGAIGLLSLLALDHMSRGADYVALTAFTNLPVFVSVGLGSLHDRSVPPRSVMAALLLLGAAAACSWRYSTEPALAEMDL